MQNLLLCSPTTASKRRSAAAAASGGYRSGPPVLMTHSQHAQLSSPGPSEGPADCPQANSSPLLALKQPFNRF